MEIEDLKDIWRKQNEAFRPKDESELATMLKGRSTSIITHLKRSVWFELIFTLVAGLGLLAYALTLPGGWLKWTSISMVALFCIYSVYYYKKLDLLNRFDLANENLKASLTRLIRNLKSYLKFYKRSYAVLYPLYFFLGLMFTAIEYGAQGFFNRVSQPEVILSLAAFALLIFVCSTSLTTWYLRKLYGNHLEKLEKLLEELQTTGEEDN